MLQSKYNRSQQKNHTFTTRTGDIAVKTRKGYSIERMVNAIGTMPLRR